MTNDAQKVLAQCKLYTDDIIYTVVKLPPSALWAGAGVLAEIGMPFSAFIADKDEVSLVMPLEAWQAYTNRLPGASQHGRYRLITFDLELDFELIGFMALIAEIMRDIEIPILALSAFSRDHLLIPDDRFQKAWDALASQKDKER